MSGRLPSTFATPVRGFEAELGAAGVGLALKKARIPFTATFYHLPGGLCVCSSQSPFALCFFVALLVCVLLS